MSPPAGVLGGQLLEVGQQRLTRGTSTRWKNAGPTRPPAFPCVEVNEALDHLGMRRAGTFAAILAKVCSRRSRAAANHDEYCGTPCRRRAARSLETKRRDVVLTAAFGHPLILMSAPSAAATRSGRSRRMSPSRRPSRGTAYGQAQHSAPGSCSRRPPWPRRPGRACRGRRRYSSRTSPTGTTAAPGSDPR